MKLLKLPPYYYPEQISSSHLTKDIEDSYNKYGIEAIIITPTPCRGISKEIRKQYQKKFYEERHGGAIKVFRFKMVREPQNWVLRAVRYCFIQWIQYWRAIKIEGIDVISASSTPPTMGLLISKVKKKLIRKNGKDIFFVYELQDVFPDSLVSAGLTKENSILYRIGYKIAMKTYQTADKIVVISDDIRRNLLSKNIPDNKIVLIHNWIDTDLFFPVPREKNKLYEEFHIPRNAFIVLYAGNLGKAQGVSLIPEVAQLLSMYKEIIFVVFGNGSDEGFLRKSIEIKGLTNTFIFPLLPAERISEVYSLGDICLIMCRTGTGKGAFPSKTATILATGTPILASFDLDSELSYFIQNHRCGKVVTPENPSQLAEAILTMKNEKYDYQKIRECAIQYFDKKINVKRRMDVLNNEKNTSIQSV